jgi:hypothetical protein
MASFSISAAQEPTQPVAPNAAPPGDQPKIELLNPVYDFGSVLQGQQVNHSFKIKNSGRGDLVINKVQTSCGCTVAEPTKKRLKQGEDAEIGVMFDTRHQKGHRVRTITALTNDPQMSNAAMTLQGDVKVEVEATPEEVSFDKVRFGSDQSREVEVNYLGGAKDFKVSGVSNTSPNIKVTQEPAADAKSGAKVKVDLLKTMPVGPFDDTIEIATNRQPLQVHVFGEVVGDLTVEPAQVSFGIVPHGQGVMRIVRLTNSGPNKVQVTGVVTTNQSVTANVDSIAPGKEYKITIQLRKGTPDGQLRGALKITTDNPNQAALTVPFYAIVGSFEG